MHGWCSIDGDVKLWINFIVEDCSQCMAGAVLMVL